MASHSYQLQASGLIDRIGMPGVNMITYIRRYADYLNEKRAAYKVLGYDFCKIERGFVYSILIMNNVSFCLTLKKGQCTSSNDAYRPSMCYRFYYTMNKFLFKF